MVVEKLRGFAADDNDGGTNHPRFWRHRHRRQQERYSIVYNTYYAEGYSGPLARESHLNIILCCETLLCSMIILQESHS